MARVNPEKIDELRRAAKAVFVDVAAPLAKELSELLTYAADKLSEYADTKEEAAPVTTEKE